MWKRIKKWWQGLFKEQLPPREVIEKNFQESGEILASLKDLRNP